MITPSPRAAVLAVLAASLSTAAAESKGAADAASAADKTVTQAFADIAALDRCSRNQAAQAAAAETTEEVPVAALPTPAPDPYPESTDPGKAEAACREKFSFESVIDTDKNLYLPPNETLGYLECKAAALNDVAVCEKAAFLRKNDKEVKDPKNSGRRPMKPVGQCQVDFDSLRLIHSLITRRKDASDRCRILLTRRGDHTEQDAAVLCGAGLQAGSDMGGACAKAAPLFDKLAPGKGPQECRKKYRQLWGLENDCDRVFSDEQVRICQASAALRKATAANDAAACGASPECRALVSGAAAACAPWVEKGRAAYCKAYAKNATAVDAKQVAAFRAQRKADDKRRQDLAARQRKEAAAAAAQKRIKGAENACGALMTAAQSSMTRAYEVTYGIEPKSSDKFREALDRLGALNRRWLQVSSDIAKRAPKHSAPPQGQKPVKR